jgi:signal transduction histidine kinase
VTRVDEVQPASFDAGEVVRSLSAISQELLSSYDKLARRAERVEHELVVANEELARKVAELDAILAALPSGVVVRDESGRIVRANQSACAILGASEASLVAAGAHAHLSGRQASGECREVEVEGRRRVLASRWSEIRDAHGAQRGSVEIVDDRTAVEDLEERVRSQSKMAALGNMAGGIAHEIRNPLNAVRGFAELLKRELPADGKAARYAARICEGAHEADQIISSMTSLASRERLSLELVEPRGMVEEAIASALRVAPAERASEWKVECVVDAPAFRCDRIKLRQALRNLVANAIQAQPRGGWVRVECRVEGAELALRVKDGGPGIPRELARRVAEPFFTTRAEGTGLGLALVHTIADLHGGRFEVSPTKASAGGAEVSIHIPLHIA